MKKNITIFFTLLLLFSLSACGKSEEMTRTKDIAILYTGDAHVSLESTIGYEGIAALKTEMTEDNMNVLLVDTGDAIQGTPIGKLSAGQVPIDIMNELGYCAMTLGNHEFDYGMETLEELSKRAKFPFLSLNFVENESQNTVYEAYTMVESDGVKIAFVGVSTPKTITSSTPAFFQDSSGQFIYSFLQDESGEKLWKAVQQTVDQARNDGADYIIALTHLGIDNSTTPYLSTNMIANTNGIDVVLDGHSHSTLPCERVKNKDGKRILLSSTGSKLENIGYLLLDKEGALSTGLVSEYEKKDEKTNQSITKKKEIFQETLGKEVATVDKELVVEDPQTGARIVRSAETNLGSLCADAIRAAADADIAIQNGGGVRNKLSAGIASYGDLLSVLPFGNQICLIEVTGQQVLDALELSVSVVPDEFGGFLQVSGLEFEFRTDIASPVKKDENNMFTGIEGERRVQQVFVGGKKLEASQAYTLAGAEYTLLSGGDGYTMFAESNVINMQIAVDYDVLLDYFSNQYSQNNKLYEDPYGNGRIVAIP